MSATFDQAIALYQAGRLGAAREALTAWLAHTPADATAWSALGYVTRDIGDAAASGAAFDRALALRPGDAVALNGRARMALERGEGDVIARYDAALKASPGDARLLIERTEARMGAGDASAVADFAAVMRTNPGWAEGAIELGRMLWETQRDPDFDVAIRAVLRREPGRRDVWRQYIALLQGCSLHAAAADACARARAATGDPGFALMEAVHAGRAGDLDRAEALFAIAPAGLPERDVHLAVHRVRQGRLEDARDAVEGALTAHGDDVSSWAVAELVWRALGDPRAGWLSGQDGLVRVSELTLTPGRLDAVRAVLRGLLADGVQMIDQSVRAGTQTRWRLFDRHEPELAELRRALEVAVGDYVAGLPPADPRHPLLRHRDAPLAIGGSWSVRLTGSGFHVSHIHPLGVLSSDCYFVVTDGVAESGEGWLELGRPPVDLGLALEPLVAVPPAVGRLVLFPSYLHHGTRPFAHGERISVAFDVIRDPGAS